MLITYRGSYVRLDRLSCIEIPDYDCKNSNRVIFKPIIFRDEMFIFWHFRIGFISELILARIVSFYLGHNAN